LRRQGRAKGFVVNAFRDLVGESRYRWMEDLGNLAIATGEGGVQIKNPAAVSALLDLASHAARERRRVMLYCACEFPRVDEKLACHRLTITDLAHATKIGQAISVVEWPGGEPVEARLKVDHKLFSAAMRGRMSIPFDSNRLSDFAGLPWGSLVALDCDSSATTGYAAVGPARFAVSKSVDGYWYLPVIEPPGPGVSKETLLRHAARWRKAHGLDERKSR